jgi:DNA-binding transcriptional ArsR family regulator
MLVSDHPRLDGHTLKVLATHPLRTRLLGRLRTGGPATATTLARDLDTNSGATSYHLRRLAEVDLVTELPDGRGRERWWQATHQIHDWFASDLAGDEEGEDAVLLLRAEHWRLFTEQAEHWMAHEREWSPRWRDLAGAGDVQVRLGPESLAALQEEVYAVLERYMGRGPEEGAPPVNVWMHWLPEGEPS